MTKKKKWHVEADLQYVNGASCLPWKMLRGKSVFVTGGTGLIGSMLVRSLCYVNKKKKLDMKVMILVRNLEKAKQQFQKELSEEATLNFLEGSVEDLPSITESIDYIIHGACPTASKYFVEYPVEVIKTSVNGTMNVLELAKEKAVKGFVYLSSMEVYGEIRDERPLTEEMLGEFSLSNVRNSYPESKRMCELLCLSYAKEYGVPAKSIRLVQTFGPGISKEDQRVFAMMANCVLSGEDIVLQTEGKSKHPYLYTAEAVTAILTVLLKGKVGEVYHAANPETYCSIYEMGELVAKQIAGGNIKVKIAEQGGTTNYPKPSYLRLDTGKIETLGWEAKVSLLEMYERMLEEM